MLPGQPHPFAGVFAWACRAVVSLGLAGVALATWNAAAQPSCGPWPKPNRWPLLAPSLLACALAVGGAWWLLGRAARLEDGPARWFGMIGTTGAALFVCVIAVLFIALMTFC